METKELTKEQTDALRDLDKAADALYRQGEALIRMGHMKAARSSFEKILREYPSSSRAPEAERQVRQLRGRQSRW